MSLLFCFHPSSLEFTVQFDTGSSDLWVIAPSGTSINLVNTTDIIADETYGAGEATGPISFAELQLGGYTVPSQGACDALITLYVP